MGETPDCDAEQEARPQSKTNSVHIDIWRPEANQECSHTDTNLQIRIGTQTRMEAIQNAHQDESSFFRIQTLEKSKWSRIQIVAEIWKKRIAELMLAGIYGILSRLDEELVVQHLAALINARRYTARVRRGIKVLRN